MSVHVTDHALVRYLERMLDVDVEHLRVMIAEHCARHQGAPCVKAGGARFMITDNVVVSCLADSTVPHFDVLTRLMRGR